MFCRLENRASGRCLDICIIVVILQIVGFWINSVTITVVVVMQLLIVPFQIVSPEVGTISKTLSVLLVIKPFFRERRNRSISGSVMVGKKIVAREVKKFIPSVGMLDADRSFEETVVNNSTNTT